MIDCFLITSQAKTRSHHRFNYHANDLDLMLIICIRKMRPISRVLVEAGVVGLVLVILYMLLIKSSDFLSLGLDQNPLLLVAASGALTHILFEYSGANQYWYDHYKD